MASGPAQQNNKERTARQEPPAADLQGREPEAQHRLSPGNWAEVLARVRTRKEKGLGTGSGPENSHG